MGQFLPGRYGHGVGSGTVALTRLDPRPALGPLGSDLPIILVISSSINLGPVQEH